MEKQREATLAALPRLARENAIAAAIPCKICCRPAMFFDVVDFQKCVGDYAFGPSGVHVSWHRCDYCGFLFTPFFDDWSHTDFARFIYNEDYVLVDPEYTSKRPEAVAGVLAELLAGFEGARILDYGAGGGVLAGTMAQRGFPHVTSYDPFSVPQRPAGAFDIIFCNEVIEHTVFPLRTIQDMRSMLTDDGCIVLGESLQPPDIDQLRGNWWYIAPRNGHVSTFSDRTCAIMAGQCDMIFHRGPNSLHALLARDDTPLATVARRCGPSMASYRLGAPATGSVSGWSGVEDTPPGQFRWTTSATVGWQVVVPAWNPRHVRVTVPFAHESRRDFAAGCVIEFNGRAAKTWMEQKSIQAEVGPADAGSAVITLRTPPPTPSGDRNIGIAVLVEQAFSDG